MKYKILILSLVLMTIVLIFTTACKKEKLPEVSTITVTNIHGASASSGGTITSDGGSAITSRGVCWSTGTTPTIDDNKTSDGTGTASFVSNVKDLLPFTTYYVRAYATNAAGTGYGNSISFSTIGLALGDNYHGGIISYFYQPGDPGYVVGELHGLIVADSDQSISIKWDNGTSMHTNAISTLIGGGITNTNTIVYCQGSGNYAAKLCYDLVSDGNNNWYLPSINELTKILWQASPGLFYNSGAQYWSSTEDEYYNMQAYEMDCYGVTGSVSKENLYAVRAISYF
jgi:hypothetical protein